MHILLIHNNNNLAKDLLEFCSKNQDTLDIASTNDEGLLYAHSPVYDLILYNPTPSIHDTLSFIHTLRHERIVTPLVLLSKNAPVEDMIKALDAGADDYFTSAMPVELFSARIRALSRRNTTYHGNLLNYHDVTLNMGTFELTCGQLHTKLRLKEAKICELLLSSPNQIIPKTLLIEKIWGLDSEATYNNVEVYVSFLRSKLKELNSKVKIRTVRGVGYQLDFSK